MERLLVITDNVKNVRLYRESLLFQVEGYDDSTLELYEIPEVRRFFLKLTSEWPHWLFFLHRNVGAIALLLALLCKVQAVRGNDGQVGTEFLDMAEMKRVFHDLRHYRQRGQ